KWRFEKLRRKNRAFRELVNRFKESNHTQTDEEFLRTCFHSPSTEETRMSLAVRRAIAQFGRIAPAYILADSTFYNLEGLPGWGARVDAFFDYMRFARLLEIRLQRKVSINELEALPSVETDSTLTIKSFVRAVTTRFSITENV